MSEGTTLPAALRVPLLRPAIALALAAAWAQPALAEKVTATGTSHVVIVSPLSLIADQQMNFGLIAPTPVAGTVVMNPDTQVCTTTGGVVHTGACTAAQVVGMGVRRMTLRIAVPTSVTLTGPGGRTMVVNNMTLDTSPELRFIGGRGLGLGNGNRRYEISSLLGIFAFRIGGTLNVGANQGGGVYTGTFPITVQYL